MPAGDLPRIGLRARGALGPVHRRLLDSGHGERLRSKLVFKFAGMRKVQLFGCTHSVVVFQHSQIRY